MTEKPTSAARRRGVAMAAILVAALSLPVPSRAADRVSAFGRYSGYGEAAYDGWERRAEYVALPDGVQIAVHYFLPTAGGQPASEPLPALLLYTRYLRVYEVDGQVVSPVEQESLYQTLIRNGYVVAIANARGTGASFGVKNGPFPEETRSDISEVVEWLAAQEWCDGHIGMIGRSNPAMAALLAASQPAPHLGAVFAEMAGASVYDFVFGGGIFQQPFVSYVGRLTRWMDTGQLAVPAPVDSDPEGTMRDAAVAEHADNLWMDRLPRRKLQYRDGSITRPNGATWSWEIASSLDDSAALRKAAVPIYHFLGWYDSYTTQQAIGYDNLKASARKMAIGPWAHQDGFGGTVHAVEMLRWFDYWLKGIDNGVAREKPVHYYLMRGNKTVPAEPGSFRSRDETEAEDGRRWQRTRRWPPRKARSTRYYLAAGPSGTVTSVNDGLLTAEPPGAAGGRDDYQVDYTTTAGSLSRWMNARGGQREEPEGTTFFDERTAEDEKSLTYTSPPFAQARAVVGYPVVHLWVTSTDKDGDFYLYLEEVDAEGRSHYVTEGALRSSLRPLAEPPWSNFGLPFHRCFKRDRVKRLPSEPVELVFDLMGTAIVIDAGHRIRIAVAGADALNRELYPDRRGKKAPTISLYRDAEHPSHIELPMMRARP